MYLIITVLLDDFEVAQKKCIKAKSRSDVSSAEDSVETRKLRKRKKVSTSEHCKCLLFVVYSCLQNILVGTDDELNFEKSAIQVSAKSSLIKKLTISKKPTNDWSPLKASVINSSFAHITSSPLSQNTEKLLDIKNQNSKTKIKDNAIANSIPSDDDIARAAHYRPKRSLFSTSPIKISPRPTLSVLNRNMKYNMYLHYNIFQIILLLLNHIITLKYEIRSIHEKLDIIIQRDEENTLTKTRESQFLYDTCGIDDKLPIKSQENLKEFENELSVDKSYRQQLVKRLSSIVGKSIKIMVKRIMTLMFTPDLLCKFSYNGRRNKKCSFEKLLVNKIIFESVKTIKKIATSDNLSNEIEQVIKYVLIQMPFKMY
ncbi:hypothetical protein QTP88_000878 [Uroleucon formosanum]